MKNDATTTGTERAVVVTTAHRGVFFGYLEGPLTDAPTVLLRRARMCVYWSADIKGVLGLAASGPSGTCRVGPAVPSIVLREVTATVEASEQATAAWECGPWA